MNEYRVENPECDGVKRCAADRAERVAGCLLGAAVGSALGAPFIGEWGRDVPSGRKLLAGFAPYALHDELPAGQYTGDTQLMFALVESIVVAEGVRPALAAEAMADLWATGRLCSANLPLTRALARFHRSGDWSTSGAPEGYADSGPAVRSAALGLYFWDRAEMLGETTATLARVTHADERSIAGAVAVAQAVQYLARKPNSAAAPFADAVADAVEPFEERFAEILRQLPDLAAMKSAAGSRVVATAGMFDRDLSEPIITPFVIPTVLAAFWVLLRHGNDWSAAVAAAVKLGGNTDALGALVGALMGVKLGASAIPAALRTGVRDAGLIVRLAHDYSSLLASAESVAERRAA